MGAWLGAGVVTRLPRRRIQAGMGLAVYNMTKWGVGAFSEALLEALRHPVHALAGLPAGLLWWLLAPRVVFVVTDAGPEPIDASIPLLVPGQEETIEFEVAARLVDLANQCLAGLDGQTGRPQDGVAGEDLGCGPG